MKVLFIINPVAGKGQALKKISEIRTEMEKVLDVEYEIVFSEKVGHASEIAKNGAEKKTDIVFAVGGDGTVNEVANGLANTNTALGIIPCGSGNDFVRSLGLKKDEKDIITRTINGVIRPVDVGLINDRYFVNISSVGFDADVVVATQKAKKFFLSGSAAYVAGLISTIFTRKPAKVKMKIDNCEIEDKILLIAVANGKFYGGGMKAAPYAELDDGLFDICFISTLPKLKMLVLFPQFMKGKHEKFKEVKFFRSSNVYIESDDLISVNIDGEVIKDKIVSFKLIRGGISIAMPAAESI
jgi:lipid kinase, YegS/Rv2252/BmrU family